MNWKEALRLMRRDPGVGVELDEAGGLGRPRSC